MLPPAVWDSSIVVGKYFERRGRSWAVGLRCLDLSAGCGLVGATTRHLTPELYDLITALLLRTNLKIKSLSLTRTCSRDRMQSSAQTCSFTPDQPWTAIFLLPAQLAQPSKVRLS